MVTHTVTVRRMRNTENKIQMQLKLYWIESTKEHEAIDIVYLVRPERCEDEVHLDED